MTINHEHLEHFIGNIHSCEHGSYNHLSLTLSIDAIEDLVVEHNQLQREVYDLESSVRVMEKMKPMWAMGYTTDSVAAQASTSALSQLWEMLGVDNQTAAVSRLREVIDSSK